MEEALSTCPSKNLNKCGSSSNVSVAQMILKTYHCQYPLTVCLPIIKSCHRSIKLVQMIANDINHTIDYIMPWNQYSIGSKLIIYISFSFNYIIVVDRQVKLSQVISQDNCYSLILINYKSTQYYNIAIIIVSWL